MELPVLEPQSLKKLSFKPLKRALDLFSPAHGHYPLPDPQSKKIRISYKEMDDNNEPNSLMYECENILSSLIVNPDTTSTPHQLPSNDYQLQSTDSLLQKSSTSPPPAPPEVSSSSSSPPPPSKIICFGNPSSPMDDPTKAGFSYGNYLTTMGATVLGTDSNMHQQAGNTAYNRRVRSAVIKPLVAERNRREKLNEHFIALSAQIPALKKIADINFWLQSSVMPSGNSTLYITIISQMNIEFCLTAKDIVKNLKATFRQFGRLAAT